MTSTSTRSSDRAIAAIAMLACCACGCGGGLAPRAPVTTPDVDPPQATALSPSERAAYDRQRIEIREQGSSYDLWLGGCRLHERVFRRVYREMTGVNDVDDDAHRRAREKNWMLLSFGGGLTLVGGGGATAFAFAQPKNCEENRGSGRCGEGAVGIAFMALVGGVGLYTLGCGLFKGADCIYDGNVGLGPAELQLDDAKRFVTRYNAALLLRLTHAGPLPTPASAGAPRLLSRGPPTPRKKEESPRVRFTLSGVVGTF